MKKRVRNKVRRRVAEAVWGKWKDRRGRPSGHFRSYERGWTKNRWIPGFSMPGHSLEQMRKAGVAHLDGDTLIIHREGSGRCPRSVFLSEKSKWAVMCGRMICTSRGHLFVNGYEGECPFEGDVVGHHPRSRHLDGHFVK